MSPRFVWGARSDVGRVREINQDSLHAQEGLFVVADGMGGHRGGEVASAVAIEAMITVVGPTTIDHLVGRVHEANSAIMQRAAGDIELNGMGTTLCAVALLHEPGDPEPVRLGIVNVGDSRVYRFADDRLVQVTEDHSLVETLVREGRISPEEAIGHPQRNILTRALGIGLDLEVDYWELPVHLGDMYLLCSDGLFNEVSDAQISATIRRLAQPAEIVDELVRMANESGSRDNVSVVVARVETGIDAEAPAVAPAMSAESITTEVPLVDGSPRYAFDGPPSEVPPPPPPPSPPPPPPPPPPSPGAHLDPPLAPTPPWSSSADAVDEQVSVTATPPPASVEPPTLEIPIADGSEQPPSPIEPVVGDSPIPQAPPEALADATPLSAPSAPTQGDPVPEAFAASLPPPKRPWWKFWVR